LKVRNPQEIYRFSERPLLKCRVFLHITASSCTNLSAEEINQLTDAGFHIYVHRKDGVELVTLYCGVCSLHILSTNGTFRNLTINVLIMRLIDFAALAMLHKQSSPLCGLINSATTLERIDGRIQLVHHNDEISRFPHLCTRCKRHPASLQLSSCKQEPYHAMCRDCVNKHPTCDCCGGSSATCKRIKMIPDGQSIWKLKIIGVMLINFLIALKHKNYKKYAFTEEGRKYYTQMRMSNCDEVSANRFWSNLIERILKEEYPSG
jgi:hypothetical protein